MDLIPLHLADLTWTLAQEPNPDGSQSTSTDGGNGGGNPPAGGGTGGGLGIWLWILPLLLLWIFILGRGGSKQRKKQAEMLASLSKGSKVITVGGIKGSVVEVRDDEVLVKVDESANTRLRFTRDAIRTVINDKPADTAVAKPDADKTDKK